MLGKRILLLRNVTVSQFYLAVIPVTGSSTSSSGNNTAAAATLSLNPYLPRVSVADSEGGKLGALITTARRRSLHCGEYVELYIFLRAFTWHASPTAESRRGAFSLPCAVSEYYRLSGVHYPLTTSQTPVSFGGHGELSPSHGPQKLYVCFYEIFEYLAVKS